MILPGFAAEMSLGRTVGRYLTVRRLGFPAWGAAAAQMESAPTRQVGSNGKEFCRPGCGRCNEVSPGRWQQICINPNCDERTVGCAPVPLCGPCMPVPGSSTNCAQDCTNPGALDPRPFSRPCPCPPPTPPPVPPPGDDCSWWQYFWCPPHWGFCKVFCAQSTDKNACYRGCTGFFDCDCSP